MNLILLDPAEVAPPGDPGLIGAPHHVRLEGVRAAHIRHVLRAVPGQTLRVGLIDGPLGTATVGALDADGVELACVFEPEPPASQPIDLLLALPRPKVLRRLWAPLAALGVGRVILTNAEKVERDYFDAHYTRPEIYRPLLLEGLQQARDTRVPPVTIHKRFRVLIEDELDALSSPERLRLVAEPGEARSLLPPCAADGARALVAIGPEGGWNTYELTLLAARGFTPLSMGSRTLRSDVACIAALTLVRHSLGV